MARFLVATALGLCTKSSADVIELDMFRAMSSDDVGKFSTQNDDTADLTGVLKYIHTEVIAEHSMSPPTRKSRKYGISAIAMWRWKVQNTDDLLSDPQGGQFVDFGPFLAFDYGQATAPIGDQIVTEHGDYVGLQLQYGDARFPINYPFYWYSATGFCPNLPWICTRGYFDPDTHEPCMDGGPPTHRCPPENPCPGKGTPDSPSSHCIKYDGTDKIARGGLCEDWDSPDFTGPTGEPGCTYSYSKEFKKVLIDDLIGITQEDCGGRKCKDWLDFRQNCKDKDLKRQFDPISRKVEKVSFCVEYDVHPNCVNDCNDPSCLAIPEDQRELGLPFWRGRCISQRNVERVEQLAAMFGIENAQTGHNIVKADIQKRQQECVVAGRAAVCNPDSLSGGPYCSRRFSGVCTPCYIPGTKMIYPANATQPSCPLDLFTEVNPDYGPDSMFNKPECKTTKPSDLCCIYINSCDGETDPTKVGFDDDGLAIVTAQASLEGKSDPLIAYYKRIAANANFGEYVADDAALQKFAYWQWSISLNPVNFADLKPRLQPFFTHDAPPKPKGGGKGVIIAIVALLLIAAAVAGFLYKRQKAAQARTALLGAAGQA